MQPKKGYTQPQRSGKILVTMNAIADYYGRDVKTIKHLIAKENFPATMVCGRWESHTDLIDDYRKCRIGKATGCVAMVD